MKSTRIKIRSIYSTALTKLALDAGYAVVQPSTVVRERFRLESASDVDGDILVRDRGNLQGVELCGHPENICQFLTFLQEQLPDVILMGLDALKEEQHIMKARIEFPGGSKAFLDDIRKAVTPTVHRHHRLRIIDAGSLERAEDDLLNHPNHQKHLENRLFSESILLPLEKNGIARLEHVRPGGKPMRPREGVLVKVEADTIVFRRSFSSGRYDGLDLPIQPGDYGLTEIQEGAWHIKHSYFTREGRLIGEYFNINTPVELYPYGARYLDLEVDVIRRAQEPPMVIDREKLALLGRNGQIAPSLAVKAMEVADELVQHLS